MQATLQITNADAKVIEVLKSMANLLPNAKLKITKPSKKSAQEDYEFVPLKHSSSAKRWDSYTPKQKAEAKALYEAMCAEAADED